MKPYKILMTCILLMTFTQGFAQQIGIKGMISRSMYKFNTNSVEPVQSFNAGLISEIGINLKKDSSIVLVLSGAVYTSKHEFINTYAHHSCYGCLDYVHKIKYSEFNPQIGILFRLPYKINIHLFNYLCPLKIYAKSEITKNSTGTIVWNESTLLLLREGSFKYGGYGIEINYPFSIGEKYPEFTIGALFHWDNFGTSYYGSVAVINTGFRYSNDISFKRAFMGITLGIGIK